jgi:hypothetical protein
LRTEYVLLKAVTVGDETGASQRSVGDFDGNAKTSFHGYLKTEFLSSVEMSVQSSKQSPVANNETSILHCVPGTEILGLFRASDG